LDPLKEIRARVERLREDIKSEIDVAVDRLSKMQAQYAAYSNVLMELNQVESPPGTRPQHPLS